MNLKKSMIYKVSTVLALGLGFGIASLVHFPASGSLNSTGTKLNLVTSVSAMSSGRVPSAEIRPDGYGWVLTTEGLEITTNGGDSFTIATSPIPSPSIHDVAVIGRNIHIATVVNSKPTIEFSNDLGTTWREVSLPSGSKNAGFAQFITSQGNILGLLVTDVTSSNFSAGEWYSTSDGGMTWIQHEIPAASAITAIGGDLWLAAGPQFTALYRSSDQGTSWAKVATPKSSSTHIGALSVPGQLKNGNVVLVSTEMNENGAPKFGVTIYLSNDLGVTWKALTHVSFAGQINSGEGVTGAVYGNSIWLGSPTDEKLVIISPTGVESSTNTTGDVYPGASIASISPTANSAAWVTALKDKCPAGKSSCIEVGALLKTVDSGKTWSMVKLNPTPIS